MLPQIMEEVIKYRWGALPDSQREGIKTYISNLIIKLCTDEGSFRREHIFLNKMNMILVQILKQVCPPFPTRAPLPSSRLSAAPCRARAFVVQPQKRKA